MGGGGDLCGRFKRAAIWGKNECFKRKNLRLTNIKLLSKIQRNSITHWNLKTIITPMRGDLCDYPPRRQKKKNSYAITPNT